LKIRLESINKNFDSIKVIENFSIEFSMKENVCFFGKSGCGKTTLLNIIAGIINADSGSIQGLTEKKISYVFQDKRLLENLSALENVLIVTDGKKKKYEEAKNLLTNMGLFNSMKKMPFELSGGMKQRINIARALIYEPDILIMDEPFSDLDEDMKSGVIDLIKSNTKDVLTLFVTHNWSEAQSFSDKIYKLSGPPLKIDDVIIP
jgi:NitT/TauT family transport system ATP-binding protein